MPSSQAQRRRLEHARKRALQHHDLRLSESDLFAMVRQIEAANGQQTLSVVHLERLSNTTSLLAINWRGHWLPLVYQKALRHIKTIYPANELEKRRFEPPRPPTPEEQIEDFLFDRVQRPVVFHAVRP